MRSINCDCDGNTSQILRIFVPKAILSCTSKKGSPNFECRAFLKRGSWTAINQLAILCTRVTATTSALPPVGRSESEKCLEHLESFRSTDVDDVYCI